MQTRDKIEKNRVTLLVAYKEVVVIYKIKDIK